MKKYLLTLTILLSFSILIVSCGGSSSDNTNNAEEAKNESDNSSDNDKVAIPGMGKLSDAVNKIQEVADKIEKGEMEAQEPVNFRKIKEFLPESVAGLTRKSASGESTGMAGFKISKAEGKYEGEDKAYAKIEIVDAAAAGMGMLSLAHWSMIDIDKEGDDGYERTFKFKGGKAYEAYNTKRNSGEINFVAGDRMIISISGRNITSEQLKSIAESIDMEGLAALKADEE